MRPRLFALLGVTALAAGCASAPGAPLGAARFSAGALVAAPEGVVAYCARAAAVCSGMEAAPSREASATELFRAFVAGAPADPSREEATLDPQRWRELAGVNRAVNLALRPVSDSEQYGADDLWASPLTESGARWASGDCEDFALEKRERLIALGWPAAALAVSLGYAEEVGLHAILLVQTDRGDFVLDNRSDAPQAVERAPYAWVTRQVGPNLDRWAVAELAR